MVREEFIRHAKHQMELRPTGTMGFRADPSPSPPRCTDLVLGRVTYSNPVLRRDHLSGTMGPLLAKRSVAKRSMRKGKRGRGM